MGEKRNALKAIQATDYREKLASLQVRLGMKQVAREQIARIEGRQLSQARPCEVLPVSRLVKGNTLDPAAERERRGGRRVGPELPRGDAEPGSEQDILEQIGAIGRANAIARQHATDGAAMPEELRSGRKDSGEGRARGRRGGR
ncbi:hypothetical protein [Chondromyces crocatus]|uniref:hypothetical protein n=1 Tax=Chondromyces crocatus TaxID=52 RepID=UPI0012E31DA6|nr:hypothetical protein [Chondromyces crocatus]